MFKNLILKQAAKRGVKVLKTRKVNSFDRWIARKAGTVMTRKLSFMRLIKN